MTKPASRSYSAPALEKGLDILELLARTPGKHSLADVADSLGRSKSEIFRMLAVLERRGFLARESGDERYELTPLLLELAMAHPPLAHLVETARPEMEVLSARARQSCHLAVASRDEIVVIARVESPAEVGCAARVGHRRRIEESTSGRVLLAFRNADGLAAAVEGIRSKRDLGAPKLTRRLALVRRRGYEQARSTYVDGVSDLSVPLFDGKTDGAVASLTIPYLRRRGEGPDLTEVLAELQMAGARISRLLRAASGSARAEVRPESNAITAVDAAPPRDDRGPKRSAAPASAPLGAADIAARIDHTLLKPDATREAFDRLCDEAIQYGFKAVCVNSAQVGHVAERLRGTEVRVCAVIGFPLGAMDSGAKAYEAKKAVAKGASELDMVLNIGALKSGNLSAVEADIRAVRRVARRPTVLKVIIETCLLTDQEKVIACGLCQNAGADFVKTSTGFADGGATVADVGLMRRAVGSKMGVKASGGIKDFATAARMLAAGADRIGAGAGVQIVEGAARSRKNRKQRRVRDST